MIHKLIDEKGTISAAFSPFIKVMRDKLEEDVRSTQTDQSDLACVFQNFSLASVDFPLKEGNKHTDSRGCGDDDVGYLETGPEVSRNIHALVLPLVLLLTFGGWICAILADKIRNNRWRCLVLVGAAVAMCGAPIFALIGWGIANVINGSM